MEQSRMSYNQSGVGGTNRLNASSGIFDLSPSAAETSWTLKFALILLFLLIALELLLMFHKHHFYNLLVYGIILSVFFLNYFDPTYIKFLLANVVLSIVLDIVWLIGLAAVYFSIILVILVQPCWDSTFNTQWRASEIYCLFCCYRDDLQSNL